MVFLPAPQGRLLRRNRTPSPTSIPIKSEDTPPPASSTTPIPCQSSGAPSVSYGIYLYLHTLQLIRADRSVS